MAYNGQGASSQGQYWGDAKGQGKGYQQQGWDQGYQQQGWNQGYQGAPQAYPGGTQQQYGAPGYPGQSPDSFALAQAEHQLAAIEEQTHRKEEQKKAHEVEKLAHEMRHMARSQSESLFFAKQSCAWALMNALMYGLALTGDAWNVSTWHSNSIHELTITQGLMNTEVDVECKVHTNGDMKLCNIVREWADHDGGWWTTKEMKEKVCKGSKEYCITAQRNYWAGFIPMFLLPIAAFGECMSMTLLFFYWHIKPSTAMRTTSVRLGLLGLLCAAAAFTGWMIMRPWLSGFPRMFVALAGQKGAGNGMFSGFLETWRLPCGWCLGCLLGALISNFARVMTQWNMSYHEDEEDPEGDKAFLAERDALRAAEQAHAYGSAA